MTNIHLLMNCLALSLFLYGPASYCTTNKNKKNKSKTGIDITFSNVITQNNTSGKLTATI